MKKTEATLHFLESMIGREILDYEIKRKYDADGNKISYDILVRPKQSVGYIEIDFKLTPTGGLNQTKDE
jgi:hypothetical protein